MQQALIRSISDQRNTQQLTVDHSSLMVDCHVGRARERTQRHDDDTTEMM